MAAIKTSLAFVLLVIPVSAFAQTILASFLQGYALGRIQGTLDSANTVGDDLAKYPKEEEGTELYRIRLSVALALLEATRVAFQADIFKKSGRNVAFYRKEVDAFYQTFPLCKRRDLPFQRPSPSSDKANHRFLTLRILNLHIFSSMICPLGSSLVSSADNATRFELPVGVAINP